MIGQIMELNKEIICTSELTGEAVKTYPKGTKFTVSSNGSFVFPDGKIVVPSEKVEVKGYDTEAIALRIMKYLKHDTPINEIIDEDDDYYNEKTFKEAIEEALMDILL
jgi:hypothetical protein